MHLPQLIIDLALILTTATIVTLVFKKLNQPVVLGYLLAGFLVGPFFPILPTVADSENVKLWAEIGVIFLLFGLGLEFSFKKLAKIGSAAAVTAFVEVLFMLLLGYGVGQLLGWNHLNSLFLGGILSISSTTIIIRVFSELGFSVQRFTNLVFGVLIVEDILAVLLLVVLATLAAGQGLMGFGLIVAVAKLFFFLTLWFIVGMLVLPTLLKRVRDLLDEESTVVVAIGLCLAMVVIATYSGFSAALGAFFIGSVLAETVVSHRMRHLVEPIKHLFGGIFFVSIGMLINPQLIMENAVPIIVITVLTIIGKTFSTAMGALFAGESLQVALQSGLSLAQIGEFSFIIASLGSALGVTDEFLYSIAVAVAVVTTFTTPYLIRSSNATYHFLKRHLPSQVLLRLEQYSAVTQRLSAATSSRDHVKEYFLRMFLNGVLIVSCFLIVYYAFFPWISTATESQLTASVLAFIAALILSCPFLWAFAFSPLRKKPGETFKPEEKIYYSVWNLARMVGLVILLSVLSTLFVRQVLMAMVGAGGLAVLILLSPYIRPLYEKLESHFFKNFETPQTKELPALLPWDVHLTEISIPPESDIVGKSLGDLALRKRFGLTVALIKRGNKELSPPERDDKLYPGDQLYVLGSDEQIVTFQKHIEALTPVPRASDTDPDYSVKPVILTPLSEFAFKTLKETRFQEVTRTLLVGVERQGDRILNPDSSFVFQPGDILWIVGRNDALNDAFQHIAPPL